MLQKIFDGISAIVNFVITLVKGTIDLLGMIPDALLLLTQSVGYLPSALMFAATVSITVLVIFVMLGRHHSE